MKRVFTLLMSMFLVTRVFAVLPLPVSAGEELLFSWRDSTREKEELDGAGPSGGERGDSSRSTEAGGDGTGELDDRGVFCPAAARCGTGERGWGREGSWRGRIWPGGGR